MVGDQVSSAIALIWLDHYWLGCLLQGFWPHLMMEMVRMWVAPFCHLVFVVDGVVDGVVNTITVWMLWSCLSWLWCHHQEYFPPISPSPSFSLLSLGWRRSSSAKNSVESYFIWPMRWLRFKWTLWLWWDTSQATNVHSTFNGLVLDGTWGCLKDKWIMVDPFSSCLLLP